MPQESVPKPAIPTPATSAIATPAPPESALHPALPLLCDTAILDTSRNPEFLQPRESSRGHRTSASTSTPAWSFSFTSSLARTQRFCSCFTVAVCVASFRGAKNRRNTCPKINSSASRATASEKTIPPTTAVNVIAICISASFDPQFQCKEFLLPFGQMRLRCLGKQLVVKSPKDLGDLFVALATDLHRVADLDHREQFLDVAIAQA